MLAPTIQAHRTHGLESNPNKRDSWKLTRSIWIGLFIGSLPINSFVFCLALLIVAFIETRLVIVAIAATVAFYTHAYVDPMIHHAGDFVLNHASTQPYFQHASSIPILRSIEWYNTAICGYITVFVAGLPILSLTKFTAKLVVIALFGEKKQNEQLTRSASIDQAVVVPSPISSIERTVTDSVLPSEAELVKRVADQISEAAQIAETAVQQTSSVPVALTDSHLLAMEAAASRSANDVSGSKLSKKDKRRGKSKKVTVDQLEFGSQEAFIVSPSESNFAQDKKVIVHDVHNSEMLSASNSADSSNVSLNGQQVLLHDRIWQDNFLSDGVIQELSIDESADEKLSIPAGDTASNKSEFFALNGSDSVSSTSVKSQSQSRKRKKITVKETIIDIIRWKKTESVNGPNAMLTQSSLSTTSATSANVANGGGIETQSSTGQTSRIVTEVESQTEPRQRTTSPISVISNSLAGEPLQFLLGYLSNSKRGMDRGGGK